MLSILIIAVALNSARAFNASICDFFKLDELYFHLNSEGNDANHVLSSPRKIIYNQCHTLRYYCE